MTQDDAKQTLENVNTLMELRDRWPWVVVQVGGLLITLSGMALVAFG